MKGLHSPILLRAFMFIALALMYTCVEDMYGDALAQTEVNPNEENEINALMQEESNYERRNPSENVMLPRRGRKMEDVPVGEAEEFNTVDSNVGGEDLASEEEFMNNPEIEQAGISDETDPSTYIVTLNIHDELTRLKNYKQVSADIKEFEDKYRSCLEKIPSLVWDEEEIDKCVGPDFTQIVNDISKFYYFRLITTDYCNNGIIN